MMGPRLLASAQYGAAAPLLATRRVAPRLFAPYARRSYRKPQTSFNTRQSAPTPDPNTLVQPKLVLVKRKCDQKENNSSFVIVTTNRSLPA